MTDARRPLHLAVMLGASAALYAGSMAGVALLQSDADRALTQRQAPAKDAVSRLQDGHDRLDAAIGQAADAYARAASRYDALTPTLTDTEASLSDLASRVETISGAARALPARISLPPITRVVRTSERTAQDQRDDGRLRRLTTVERSSGVVTAAIRFEGRAMGSPLRLTLGVRDTARPPGPACGRPSSTSSSEARRRCPGSARPAS